MYRIKETELESPITSDESDVDSSYGSLYAATEEASDRMDTIMDEVQRQNLALRELLPQLMSQLNVGQYFNLSIYS